MRDGNNLTHFCVMLRGMDAYGWLGGDLGSGLEGGGWKVEGGKVEVGRWRSWVGDCKMEVGRCNQSCAY